MKIELKEWIFIGVILILFAIETFIPIICFKQQSEVIQTEINQLNKTTSLMLMQLNENEQEINALDNMIIKYSKQFGVDPKLVKAISIVESGGRQEAVSSSGAVGVMQIMPSTAKAMGENPYTIEGNIKGSVKYLAYLDKKFNGDTDLVLAGYNAGEGNVIKHKGVPPFKETKNYIKKVKQTKADLENVRTSKK